MKKKQITRKLALSKTVVTRFNDLEKIQGGKTEACLDLTDAIRCGHTIGDGTDGNGNPCVGGGKLTYNYPRCGHTIGDGSDGNGNPCTI